MNNYTIPARIERYFKEVISFLLRLLLVPTIIREVICRNKVTIISYHEPSPEAFRSHLKYLAKHYNIISLDRLVSTLRGIDEWKTLPKKSLVITMDDGFSGNYNLRQALDEFKVPVTIFLNPDGLRITDNKRTSGRRYLNRQEALELLKHGVTFGAHSMTHPFLTRASYEEARYEIDESKKYLEKELSIDIKHFAYPYGDYGKREIGILKDLQYHSARTIRPGWVSEKTNPYKLRCMGIGDDDGINKMILIAAGLFPFLRIIRNKIPKKHFDEYRPWYSYIAGILHLRGPIAQHTERQAELIRKYAKGKKRLVEIGVSEGGSAIVALSVMEPDGKMWLIDPYRSTFYPHFSLSLKIAKRALAKFKDRDIILLRDYSYNVAKKWNINIDYLLLDANHSEEAFMRDLDAWGRFVNDDGVILVHSIQTPSGVETDAGRVIKRLFDKPNSEWIVIDKVDATAVLKRKSLTI